MIQTGMESRVKIQDIVSNQLPEFILDESPKAVDFLKQYYISQEYQGGPVDLTDNLDQYLKVDNLKPEVIVDSTTLSNSITSTDTVIEVSSTKGFPNQYGLFKIDDEIVTYTGITTNSFTGCIRGFSGISEFDQDSINKDLVFSTSTASAHQSSASVQNLSSLFLKEFYRKLKSTFTPGLENISFVDEIDAGNFIKRAKDFYASKGTDEAIKILFKVIFGESPSIINLEDYLIKPSSANYVRREIVIADVISGEPLNIVGETLIKTSDTSTSASISAVEGFTRKGKTFYKIELYIGNDGKSSVEGTFVITPNTKLIENASVGDSILTVDSTVSFPETGTLISGDNTISYTGKSINQFFGCTGITSDIASTSNVRSNDTYFSYEGGDTTKKVELLILGVISKFQEETEGFKTSEGDIITIKNLGDKIKNTKSNWKEIFANSFIYNTSARYQITDNSTVKLGSTIDRSSLKTGDEVEILERGTEVVVATNNPVYVQSIDIGQNTLTLLNGPTLDPNKKYDVRRKLNKAKSEASGLPDTLNLYVETDEYGYVASNSLPSKIRIDSSPVNNYRLDINTNIKSVGITSIIEDGNTGIYTAFQVSSGTVPFLTGDKVYYSPLNEPLVGLDTGTYFVEKTSNIEFRLYGAQSLISSDSYITFQKPTSGIGTHIFTLNSQVDSELGVQKLLRKFPLQKNIRNGSGELTTPGTTGMLINGVEINNYKSNDVIYYGPIESADILFGGENYDVINPPLIDVSTGLTTAYIQPVISGKFEKVYVDTQDYNIDKIVSIDISGGNGKGAVIDPVIVFRPREVLFNADELSSGGGVNPPTNQIVFLTNHNFVNGQQVVYNSLGNNPISIGTAGNNFDLPDNSSYFVEVTNNTTIRLYNNLSDQQSGTNPVGIYTGSTGSHRFSTLDSVKQIDSIRVVDPGEGYTNRKLIVDSTGIDVENNIVNFKKHGFESGELVKYYSEYSGTIGISTSNQYYILKISDNSFRLCDAGIGGTDTTNYERNNYVKFYSGGAGYQYFSYPDISVSIQYTTAGIGSTTQSTESLVVTPVVKGEIVDGYVYEGGTGYGSTILNYERKPTITIQNGKLAQLTPVVVGGRITNVSISYQGTQYYSVPDLVVSGDGTGAELRAIVTNGRISEVKVLNTGVGYAQSTTSIDIIASGKGAIIDPQIRKLTVNDNTVRFASGEVLLKGKDKLQYTVSKYFEDLRDSFLENPSSISGIVGWAYDGNPIYGPYGYTNPVNKFSALKTLESGYTLDSSNVTDRPSGFDAGFFVEDYKFNDSGDLDEYNGRFERNEDFPQGVYAYHATIDEFPYFIGNKYRSELISDSDLNQSFDFNSSNLHRNTLPYKVSELEANYDFVNETSDVLEQRIEVISVTSDSINSLEVQNAGNNYKVGDRLIFDETNTSGSGLNAIVDSVKGKSITNINTNSTSYLNSIFTWDSPEKVKITILPKHDLLDLDYITITGFSTNLSTLNGTHRISVPSYVNGRCLSTITSATVGFTTEIYVAPIPEQISIGSSIGIGTETLKVLGVFRNENILRIERGLAGTSHTVGTAVSFLPDSFTISKSLDKFESTVNDKVFFNPRESVGVSTINGVGYSTSFIFGDISVTRSIPSKGLYINNHPFVTNQPVVYVGAGATLTVSTDGLSTSEVLITSFSNLFAINKNPNLIGLKTAINGPEVFFHSNGDDDDQYTLESNYTQILNDVQKNEVTVSVSTAHELQSGDTVTLNVQPNLSVGIGNSTAVRVLYKNSIDNIVVNPIGFNSTGVNTTSNEFTLSNHELKTGDKVLYEDGFLYFLTGDQIDVTSQESNLEGLWFKPDGTKMYIIGRSGDDVNEYNLSTAWKLSTATFVTTFSVNAQENAPRGLYIKDDGLSFWVTGSNTDRVHEYSMSTAWDISTASYTNISLNVGGSGGLLSQNAPQDLHFKPDGTKLYIIGSNPDRIHELELSTPWDVTTASYAGDADASFNVNYLEGTPASISFSSDGRYMYFGGQNAHTLFTFELSTPWSLKSRITPRLDDFLYVRAGAAQDLSAIYISPNGKDFFIATVGDDVIAKLTRKTLEYYVYKINQNKINLCETEFDAKQNPPTIVSFASTGGISQSISLINPELNPIENNDLKFDLTDSSLSGYELKIYTDSQFNNEFVSTGSTPFFTIIDEGAPGVTSTASLTLRPSSDVPDVLYYTLEKEGTLVSSDEDVENYSKIRYQESIYNDVYKVTAIGTTTFNVNITTKPERSSYISTECDTLEYSTTSAFASGPVSSLKVLSFGSGYKELPSSDSTNSTNGTDLIVNAKSNTIGSLKEYKVLNNKFTYSSDRTLRPKANVSPTIVLNDFNTIDQLLIVDGGEGYASAPNLVIVNPATRNVIDSGLLKANLTSSAISSVDIDVEPSGLSDENVEIFATDNTNGISVTKVQSSNSGIFTCTLSTPGIGTTAGSGFSVQPFNIGDDVFVEGIQKFSSDGAGFNSADYGYKFFKVSLYTANGDGVNDTVTINVAGLTTNTGIAKTVQDFSGVIINKNDYPEFEVTQKLSKFNIGESLSSSGIIRDLKVAANNENKLTVSGSYDLSVGETIKGVESGAVATIQTLDHNEGSFDVAYSNVKEIGWDTETGRLSEDYQVTPNNDYYQNLSYSIKSSITYKDQQSPVENLVHTSGLKNFADTGITSSTSAGLDKTNDGFVVVYDIIDEKRVDTVNNFDNVVDQDVVNSASKFLKLENKRLVNSTILKNLNVLTVDDLSGLFSNSEAEATEFLSVAEVDDDSYHNYLFRVTNTDGSEIQLTDLTILSDGLETVIVENESLRNTDLSFGSFDIVENEFDETFLRFVPNDPFNKDYDIKLIKQTFNSVFVNSGIHTVGFVNLTGSVETEITSVGLGTTTIISVDSNEYESLYINAQVTDTITDDMNYVRLYITHDGTNTYLSEYYIDNTLSASTGNQIGTFYSDLSGGVLSITHENTASNKLMIRSNTVGFGTTTSGIGFYRFKSDDQLDGQERSAIYQSNFQSTVGIASTTIQTLDRSLFDASKSVIEVSAGSTKALHQVMMISDGTDVYTQQLPFLSVGTTDILDTASGIGTFGGEIAGSNLILKFYPDDQSQETKIEIFSKSFYTLVDNTNNYNDLNYGAITESIDEKFYNSINGSRINRTAFSLFNNTTPIFSKEFNPNSVALAATTGLFTIPNHFFQTGEELIYTPNSTIVGVGTSAMMTSATDVLPSTVYAIKVTEDTFKVAITTTAAQSGIGTTFASLGEGNAHRFTMKERNSKCIITVDKLVQYPVAFAGISHSLSGNLGISTTFVTLSGISSINPQDILLIDDEYMGVTNIGYGTTIDGPITNSGSIKLVEVDRGFVGSSASTHTNSTTVDVYRGAFNIIDNEIHFAEAPRGNPQIDKTKSNLDYETSSFSGRVFFKSNYDSNKVYDDLSEKFTGIGRTFNLTVGGANTTGIGTEGSNGLIFINNIYQSPKTDNNPTRFNYEITEGVGITTVEFSGITRADNPLEYVVSDYDINQNETPRGGIIVSYGSTPGLGFAPLVGASVTAVVGAGGSFISVGLGATDNPGSGYNGLVSIGITVVDLEYDHRFVRCVANSITDNTSATYTATDATYNSYSGVLVLTIPEHGLTDSNTVGIANDGIVFSCSKDGYSTEHAYPRLISKTKQRRGQSGGDPISGIQTNITSYTTNTITINVGSGGGIGTGADISVSSIGIGGTLSFTVGSAGTNYINPEVYVSDPSYENLPVTGVYREGIGNTTTTGVGLLMDVIVGGASTSVGIGSTYFEVRGFQFSRPGYGFMRGDVFKPVGLVTDSTLGSPLQDFEITVIDTYSDNFAAWEFGELDYIDSIKNFQNGSRVRFPLNYNGEPLSFEPQSSTPIEDNINNVLVIFINGILQEPVTNYIFEGGTSFVFTKAPLEQDEVEIYFYKGVESTDTEFFVVRPTIKTGDVVQVISNNIIPNTLTQEERTVYNLSFSDKFETNRYSGEGIDEQNYKPLSWTKQKSDKKINGEFVSKSRDVLEALVFPTAKIIKDVSTIDTDIFVDNVELFEYEDNRNNEVAPDTPYPDGSKPCDVLIVNGISTVGYSTGLVEKITGFNNIQGFSGIVTGITTSAGTGSNPLAIQFTVIHDTKNVMSAFDGLTIGNPIYIYDTTVGNEVTSIDNSDSAIIGVGNSFVDNVYNVSDFSYSTLSGTIHIGILTCNILSTTNTAGIDTSGDLLNPVGKYSWGKLSGGTRSTNPISIGVTGNTVSGLSTYPTIQRRGGVNIRATGALPKIED